MNYKTTNATLTAIYEKLDAGQKLTATEQAIYDAEVKKYEEDYADFYSDYE